MSDSERALKTVIEGLDSSRILALASMLKLHDPKAPNDSTWAHVLLDGNRPFSSLPREKQTEVLCLAISRAGGHSVANLVRGGRGIPYRDVVYDVAKRLKVEVPATATVAQVEALVAQTALRQLLESLTPEHREKLDQELEQLAAKHGKSFKTQGGALTALTAAQISGFGVYLAASTVVGAITGWLGITLSFGFYTAMSSTISVVIGPPGWIGLGLAAVYKAGTANFKKTLPAVLFVAAERQAQDV